jgi:integrase
VVGFVVVDPAGGPVEPISRFLRDFVARGNSAGSVRSYAFCLHRWWRFLIAVGVAWDRATSLEVRDFVLWLRQARKAGAPARTRSAARAGTVNPITRKQYLDDRYKVATVRHSNAVVRTFYEFWMELGAGPLVNPVPRESVRGRRPHGHHNPLAPLRAEGKLRYNPRLPRRRVRAMPDERWNELFAAMRSHRDRAILALAVSTGARASELLGVRGGDLDWGDQLVRVRRKGTQAEQWLPASPEAFVWLRLYVDEIGGVGASERVWLTLRRRRRGGGGLVRQVLTYDALRAVLRRVNEHMGTNWTMHDLRHTCALRMVRDPNLTLRDVQTVLGHAHLTTTQVYLEDDDQAMIGRVREHLSTAKNAARARAPQAAGYDGADLAVLFGEVTR